ncbi:3,4-dihydroxy-2-butanone-4-phosphate synthase [Terricaulis silvestris]|uniref:3,4-dihydroxy-2-butanone 4-phosphate synthase n=1 Tax=Terricaulis silvestris TaxID=2686094 RepID=A0A6I6MLS5_9CAUL|nr:3,4-dihydroxy-2-butanone-4-phosphate synthase [Terricaulis silvestris]QGZ93667.1 Riboflavin biosynthesis protein RibBA [Terricaulis silvestris]
MDDNVIEYAHDTIEQALHALASGGLVVVMDDRKRENEGDLIMAAEFATPAALAFIVRHTTGIVCVALEGERADALDLAPMVAANSERHQTAFTVSVDAKAGTTTGVSAADRARTILALADTASRPDDFARPGHLFPLRARAGGVLERPGHTEAAVDLARLAGCTPVGVLCEIVSEDGSMARLPELMRFARQHALPIITIADLIRYRAQGGEGLEAAPVREVSVAS